MIIDTGKSPAVIRLKDGSIITFFNNGIHETTQKRDFVDEGGNVRYSLKINSEDIDKCNRALHYVRSYPGGLINGIMQERLVIFTKPTSNTGSSVSGVNEKSLADKDLSAVPLFEVINPQIFSDGNNFQMTFWTNISDASSIQDNSYIYDPENIYKISESDISITESSVAAKALCTCPIHFEMLREFGIENALHLTPVIKQIAVIMVIKDGNYVFDFSGGDGGSGGSLGRHMHTNALNDAGFAVAVYAPSAIITPLAWS